MWFSKNAEYIIMLSIYTRKNIQRNDFRTSFIKCWKYSELLNKLIVKIINCSCFWWKITKMIFQWFNNSIKTWKNFLIMFNDEKIILSSNTDNMMFCQEREYASDHNFTLMQ